MKKTFLYRILAALIIFLSFTGQADAQKIIYVDSSAHGENDGSSWADAFKSLMVAMNVANRGIGMYILKVAKGTYFPSQNNGLPTTSRDSSFRILRDSIQMEGGYPQGGGIRNINANSTVLSGDIGVLNDTSDNSYHILTFSSESKNYPDITNATKVDGFTFIHGNASQSSGGAINISLPLYYSQYETFSSIIINCTFRNNHAKDYGGAIFVALDGSEHSFYTLQPALLNCTFINNTATSGGAFACYISGCSPSFSIFGSTFIENKANNGGACYIYAELFVYEVAFKFADCSFLNNNASSMGGGLYLNPYEYTTLNLQLSKSKLSNNTSNIAGGAIYTYTVNATLKAAEDDCRFSNNISGFGGAIYNEVADEPNGYSYQNYTNCIFNSNKAKSDGAALYNHCRDGSSLKTNITNSLFAGNSSKGKGGAIGNKGERVAFADAVCKPLISNTTFFNNWSASDSGHTIYSYFDNRKGPDTCTLNNCIIWENVKYKSRNNALKEYRGLFILNNSLLQGTVSSGTILNGNSSSLLNKYPNFVDTTKLNGADGIWATADDGLVLRKTSPAVNKGDNSYITGITTDITGAPRIQCTTVDLGAYETKCPKPVSNAMVADQNTSYNLFSVYPNPAHQYTTISFHADV